MSKKGTSGIEFMYFSNDNKRVISDIVYNVVKKDMGISLNSEFVEVMEQIMNSVYKRHKKPVDMDDKQHLKNLNTIVISECVGYINKNNVSSNNVNALSSNSNMSSSAPYNQAFSNGGIIPHQGGVMPSFSTNGGQMGQMDPRMGQMDPRMTGQIGGMDPRQMGGMDSRMMQYQPMQGMQGDGAGPLPFQQIDPRSENNLNDPEIMLAQKINDRNSLDRGRCGRAQMGGMNLPNYNNMHVSSQQEQVGKFLKNQNNVHPAVIQNFLNMTIAQQHQLGQMNPEMYHQILGTIQRMNSVQLGEDPAKKDKKRKHGKHGRHSRHGKKSDKKHDKRSRGRKRRDEDSDSESDSERDSDSDKERESGSESDSGSESESDSGSESDSESENETETRAKPPSLIRQNEYYSNLMGGHSSRSNDDSIRGSVRSGSGNSSNVEYISLDFRKDLSDIENNKYVLTFNDFHNVEKLELESCIINQSYNLEGEPYIYLLIDEVMGDYSLSSGKNRGQINVFGKLFLDKTVNGFLSYKPEHCVKRFSKPEMINKFTVSFLKYNYEKIPLNKIAVKKLSKCDHRQIKLSTKTTHNLAVEDRINIYMSDKDQILVNKLKVLEVPDKSTFKTEAPSFKIDKHPDLSFEKLDVKCTMTFKVWHSRN